MAPSYSYQVKDSQGKLLKGSREGNSRQDILTDLWEQGYTVIKVQEGSGSSFLRDLNLSSLLQKKIKPREFMVFCRQFATMLSAGMTVLNSLRILSRQAVGTDLGEALENVTVNLENGSSLAESFAARPQVFPSIFVNMIAAGEVGGILDEVLERLAHHFEKDNDLKEKIKSALTYPAVISVVTLIVITFMIVVVLPSFTEIFVGMGVELPLMTRVLLGIGTGVSSYWYIILPLIILFFLGLSRYFKTPQGRKVLDKFFIKMPIYGNLYRKVLVARFARTMGTLLTSGVGLLETLELVEKVVGNSLYARVLSRTREVVRQGYSMAETLGEGGLFPLMVLEMVSIGEETGAIDEMLQKVADFYEAEVEFVVARLSAVIEPVLIVFMAVAVGFIALAILLPMFEIFQMI
ncbi:type II secretion system F family protein [candidate division NPL-UPA2 bacterium]|nr:type II secretion system F family protein [candidate division NPL-UPA2 bacterium]